MVIFMPMTHGTNVVGTTMAVGGGMVVAASAPVATVIGQATNAISSQGQMTTIGLLISLIGFLTAGLPHAYRIIELHFADRKNAREMARAEREQVAATLDLINRLNAKEARLAEVERIAANYEELEQTARDVEARHAESQSEIAILREYVLKLIPAVGENQGDLKAVAENWNKREVPVLAAATNPAPLPASSEPETAAE